ncbi:MAG: hypothetical protein MPK75_13450, partial [Alphaproteobacteria bacterium]|nr:hypothetical protein [Alphaproteobacteria bacterium]
ERKLGQQSMYDVLFMTLHACPLQVLSLGKVLVWHTATLLVEPLTASFTLNHQPFFNSSAFTVNWHMCDLASSPFSFLIS